MNMSFSNHVSTKSHSISNRKAIAKVDKHNNRKYNIKDSNIITDKYDCIGNIQLVGSDSLLSDIQKIYDQNVDINFVEQYNERQIKNRNYSRIIKDWKGSQALGYFKHIEDNDKQNIAEEVILKLGDFEQWKMIRESNQSTAYQQVLADVYSDYLNDFQEEFPDFKIAQAIIHFDEIAPHLHIVGCPFKNGKIAKSKVFTQDTLSKNMQTNLRNKTQENFKKLGINFISINEKKKGRNLTLYRTEDFIDYNNQINELKYKVSSNKKELVEGNEIKKQLEEQLNLTASNLQNNINLIELRQQRENEIKEELEGIYSAKDISNAIEQQRQNKRNELNKLRINDVEQMQMEKTYK